MVVVKWQILILNIYLEQKRMAKTWMSVKSTIIKARQIKVPEILNAKKLMNQCTKNALKI